MGGGFLTFNWYILPGDLVRNGEAASHINFILQLIKMKTVTFIYGFTDMIWYDMIKLNDKYVAFFIDPGPVGTSWKYRSY